MTSGFSQGRGYWESTMQTLTGSTTTSPSIPVSPDSANTSDRESLVGDLQLKEQYIQKLEARCKATESRMKKKDDAIAKAKEDSAALYRTINDLRSTMHSLKDDHREKDKTQNQWQTELDALQKEIDRLRVFESKAATLERTQANLQNTEAALVDAQSRHKQDELAIQQIKNKLDTTVQEFTKKLETSSSNWRKKEENLLTEIDQLASNTFVDNLQTQIVDRDGTILDLRNKVLEYSSRITELEEQLEGSTEMEILRKQLEEARRDVEQRDTSEERKKLQEQLEHTRYSVRRLKQELDETKALKADQVRKLQDTIDELGRQAQLTTKSSTQSTSGPTTEQDLEFEELREKLADRDMTISTLVKSSVQLEQQATAAKVEVDYLKSKFLQEYGADVDMSGAAEVQRLMTEVSKHKAAEKRLSDEVQELKLMLQKESEKVTIEPSAFSGEEVETSALLLERDNAISRLVQQSMTYESTIRELKLKVNKLEEDSKIEKSAKGIKSTLSVHDEAKLREEAELYAAQVIELDDEVQNLRRQLIAKDSVITNLKRQSTQSSSQSAGALQAEIDELKEANNEQLQELRTLRKMAHEFTHAAEDIAQAKGSGERALHEADELRSQLKNLEFENKDLALQLEDERDKVGSLERKARKYNAAMDEIVELEVQIRDQGRLIEKLKVERAVAPVQAPPASAAALLVPDVDEMAVVELEEANNDLKLKLETQAIALEEAKNTIRELEEMLARHTAAESSTFEEEKEELLSEIEQVTSQLLEARTMLTDFEDERHMLAEFKSKLEDADESREAVEKQLTRDYEAKISHLTHDKDKMIDQLRNELVEMKTGGSAMATEMTAQAEEFGVQLKELKEEADAQITQREARISVLEQSLMAQQQLVQNMKMEMDHLQGSMQTSVLGRREEFEDMEEELAKLTSKSADQDREIKKLLHQLDEVRVVHKADVSKLKATIKLLEVDAIDERRDAADLQMENRLKEVKERLEKLKFKNDSLQETNQMLKQKLEGYERRDAKSDRVLALEKKTVELQQDLFSKNSRMKELEEQVVSMKEIVDAVEKKQGSKRKGFLGRR